MVAKNTNPAKGGGGSALKRLRTSLRSAGIVGQQGKASRSKKDRKKGKPSEIGKNDNASKLEIIRDEFNPFEMKMTKTKFEVVGRKVKGTEGKPTLSKQIGEENRKKTLLTEMRNKNRVGGIIDRRFGENNPNLTPEEKMLERFTRERQKSAHGGKSLFNLDDDDEGGLTHFGQSLADMDDFDDTGLGLSDDEEDKGHLNRSIVNKMHFGGFGDEEPPSQEERHKSKNEIMKELIAKSKMHKYERQAAKQEDDALREDLDEDLKDIRDLLSTNKSDRKPLPSQNSMFMKSIVKEQMANDASPKEAEKESNDYDDYDKTLRELAYDRRAQATDRTKTEEELALEEKEKLEKAEKARKRRMEGLDSDSEDEGKNKRGYKKRRNAPQGDDLDDDFVDDMESEMNQLGQGLSLEDIQNAAEQDTEDEEDEDEEDEDEEDEDEDEEESDYGDLEDDEDAPTFDDDDGEGMNEFGKNGAVLKKTPAQKTSSKTGQKELPYTFGCPTSHAEFLDILNGFEVEDAVTVTKRIRVLYHVKLAAENKAKMAAFLDVLVTHMTYLVSTVSPLPTTTLEALGSHVFEIAQQLPNVAADVFKAKVREMHDTMSQKTKHGQSLPWPDAKDMVLLRSLGQVFSTSDLSHQVATPAMLLMAHALAQCQVQNEMDIGHGLFLTLIFYEYQTVSKRFIPESLNFLQRALTYLIPKEAINDKIPGMFPLPEKLDLAIVDPTGSDSETIPAIALAQLDVKNDGNPNELRLSLVQGILRMLEKYLQLYASTPALVEVFDSVKSVMTCALEVSWHNDIQELLTALQDRLTRQIRFCQEKRSKTPLRMQQHRPIPIAQHLPKFEKGYSMDRHYDPDHERAQISKLKAQLKKEKKGAIRELRKDNMFMAREKAKVRKQKDEEYNKMVKGVMTILEGDQAEKNRLERERMKK